MNKWIKKNETAIILCFAVVFIGSISISFLGFPIEFRSSIVPKIEAYHLEVLEFKERFIKEVKEEIRKEYQKNREHKHRYHDGKAILYRQ